MKVFIFLAAMLSLSCSVQARETVTIAGSSTVYPFINETSRRFHWNDEYPQPIVKSTGTDIGFALFCSGIGVDMFDIASASRRINVDEALQCANNDVNDVVEIVIGYDGITVANSVKGATFNLSTQELFMAVARDVVIDGDVVSNPYNMWSDINPELPNTKIEILGPPPTSGTRDMFVELVLTPQCKQSYPDIDLDRCTDIRTDGVYKDSGEDDDLIVQQLTLKPNAVGIFGFTYLLANNRIIQAAAIDGIVPSFDTIADNTYPLPRPLYIYVKNEHMALIPGLRDFIDELVSEDTIGSDGYLREMGLIPLSPSVLKAVQDSVD